MGKLTGLFNRGGTNTGDVIRQSTSLTMAYLLEQNRKFEAFMRDKLAELEGRVAAQQQTRLDYFDDDETVSPDLIEDELDQEREQDAEETRPLMSLAADVDEPLGLSPAGFPPVGFGPVGPVQVTAQEETVPVEPVQTLPSWLVMLGVGEPEPAGKEETVAAHGQDPIEAEPVEDDETGWSEITAWEDTTEGDPGNDPIDEETEDETHWPETTVWEETTEDDPEEDPADEKSEETAKVTDEESAEETRVEEPIGDEEMDWPEVGMSTGVYQDEAEPANDLGDEQEEAEPADQDQDEAEWEEDLAGEEEMDWPEAEMPAVLDQDEGELKSGPDGEQEEAGGTAAQDEAEGEAEVELPGEKEVDGSETEMAAVVEQAESEVGPDPHEGPVEEIDQGPSEGVTSPTAVRMKVRKQGGVLEVGAGPAIDDEEEDTDTLLPPWLTAKL